MPNIIDEYLIRLGTSVDEVGLRKFQNAIEMATKEFELGFGAIIELALKAQIEVTAGFLAIGGAAIGLVDKVAMADQQYRLFGLHMFMSKDAARGLKIALDALNISMEDATWDPELRQRTLQLLEDQKRMAPGGDFEAQMKKVRDIRFQFTRMQVELEYLGMHVVQNFLQALGLGPDRLLEKLQAFNTWVITNLPAISQELVTDFLPVWEDVKKVVHATGEVLYETGLLFTNLVGILANDTAIEGDTLSFQKLLKAVEDVINAFARFVHGVAEVEATILRMINKITTFQEKWAWLAKLENLLIPNIEGQKPAPNPFAGTGELQKLDKLVIPTPLGTLNIPNPWGTKEKQDATAAQKAMAPYTPNVTGDPSQVNIPTGMPDWLQKPPSWLQKVENFFTEQNLNKLAATTGAQTSDQRYSVDTLLKDLEGSIVVSSIVPTQQKPTTPRYVAPYDTANLNAPQIMPNQVPGTAVDTTKSYSVSVEQLVNSIVAQESSGDPNRVSNKGAVGLMQLEEGTAKDLGVTDRTNPVQNVEAGTKYIKQLLEHYQGNLPEALAAYNWGLGHLDKFLAGKATTPMPDETKNYVSRILGKLGQTGDVKIGTVTIQITQPNASPQQIKQAVSDGMADAQKRQVQRNLQEFNDLAWSR